MKKRILAALLACVMVISLLPATALAALVLLRRSRREGENPQ